MKRNPFLKLEQKIAAKVYNNVGTLTFNVKARTYNEQTGSFTETTYVFPRTVHIKRPREISEAIVDNRLYLKGDLNVDIPYLDFAEAMKAYDDDPAIKVGEVSKTISDYRAINSINGGLDMTNDTICFVGKIYRPIKVTAKNMYAGVPSIFTVLMRAI